VPVSIESAYAPVYAKPALLVLADGTAYRGWSFGATGTARSGFNTGMTGYQEVLTDPIIAVKSSSLPIPNATGVNPEDEEFQLQACDRA